MHEDVSTLSQLQLPSNPRRLECFCQRATAYRWSPSNCLCLRNGWRIHGCVCLPGTRSCLRKCADRKRGPLLGVCVWGQWAQATRHLPPIAAFALGVAAAKLLGVRLQKRAFRATLICQAFELVTLAVLTLVGARLPDACVVPMISIVAAIQFTSFRSIGLWSFNSAMITANLREAISGLVLWRAGREATENRDKAIALSLISLFFLLGALCGGFYTRLEKHALAPCVAIVTAGFLLTWRKRGMQIHSLLPPGAVVGTGSSQN
jgi:uncharacterized membrane protein YoaK (UPF0700 family)